jgi:hypothetical protein
MRGAVCGRVRKCAATQHLPAFPAAAADLLSKPFPESHKVELKAAAGNGVTFTAEAALGPVPAPKKGKKPTRKCAGLVVEGGRELHHSRSSNALPPRPLPSWVQRRCR